MPRLMNAALDPKPLFVGLAGGHGEPDPDADFDDGLDAPATRTAARVARRFRSAVAEQPGDDWPARVYVDAEVLDSIAWRGRLLVERLQRDATLTPHEMLFHVERMVEAAEAADRWIPF